MTSSTAAASTTSAGQPSQQELAATFKAMRMDLQRLASKIGDLESERDEHRMVMESLKQLEDTRKCFRLINGVLVERTVKETTPQLEDNIKNITMLMEKILEAYSRKEKELAEFQQKHGIRVEAAAGGRGGGDSPKKTANVGLA